MKILYCGPLGPWNTTEARRRALIDLGHEVVSVDLLSHLNSGLIGKIQSHLLVGPGVASYNRKIEELGWALKPDLVWLDTGAQVRPGAVKALRSTGATVMSYNSDYLRFNRHARRHFLNSVPLYDIHVNTNEMNVTILQERGAKKVIRAEFAYDPEIHRPIELTREEASTLGSEVVFVGHWEPATERLILLLRESGISVKVWGTSWRKARNKRELSGVLQDPPAVFGQDYAKAIAASKIALGLLSKWNHNRSTLRTFEIPAMGGFLLAERTGDHLSYFEEGREAEYFGTPGELVEKAKYYLEHEDQRMEIARAGHERCTKSGYSNKDRVQAILASL